MILGVDPGYSGALAWYDPITKNIVALEKMPLLATGGVMLGGPAKKEINAERVVAIVKAMPPTLIIMEHVASSPQMGVVSSFRFGEGFGQLRGVFAALGHTVRLTKPSVWKANLGLSANKRDSVTLACRLWPSWAGAFKNGPQSADLAEAALLAYYGEKLLAPKAGPWHE